jgi:hypothetical protein
MGFYSVMGLRTPQLEGKPGFHAKLIHEIHDKVARWGDLEEEVDNTCACGFDSVVRTPCLLTRRPSMDLLLNEVCSSIESSKPFKI